MSLTTKHEGKYRILRKIETFRALMYFNTIIKFQIDTKEIGYIIKYNFGFVFDFFKQITEKESLKIMCHCIGLILCENFEWISNIDRSVIMITLAYLYDTPGSYTYTIATFWAARLGLNLLSILEIYQNI